MIWGVLIGTYSSLFVASPALTFFKLEREALLLDDDKPGPNRGQKQTVPV